MRLIPYTTPAGTDRAAAGPAMGSGRTAGGATRGVSGGHAARRRDDRSDQLGGHSCLRNRAQQQPGCGGQRACSSGPPACSSGVRFGDFSPVLVSEGGLEHPFGWYITETVIHHQPKLTRQGPPGSAFRRRIAAAPPGQHDQSERLTCGNDDRGQPESSCRPGPDGGLRTAALHHLAGMVTASRCCPEVPAPQPQPLRTSPDDLAAELNPHKTELNPHKAVEAAVGPGRMGAGRAAGLRGCASSGCRAGLPGPEAASEVMVSGHLRAPQNPAGPAGRRSAPG